MELATVEKVEEFYKRFLNSRNATIAVVGDFDSDEVRELMESLLAGMNGEMACERVVTDEKPAAPMNRSIQTPGQENAFVAAYCPVPLTNLDREAVALAMACRIFGGDPYTSRIGVRVRQANGLSYDVAASVDLENFSKSGDFEMTAICSPKDAEKVRELMIEELHRLINEGITAEELDALRTETLAAIEQDFGSDNDFHRAKRLVRHVNRLTARQLTNKIELIKQVSLEEVNAAIRKYLVVDDMSLIIAGDFEPSVAPDADVTTENPEGTTR